MLRIGDIHLRTTEADRIIETIRGYIIANPEEQHIVFFGDYVYHVQYDRKMLLRLFHLFLELTSMGKHVYVLAGNHDRVHNHFVYEESASLCALVNDQFPGAGSLRLFTQPTHVHIEGQDCLFFPSSPFLATEKISPQREELASSKKSTERTSATINSVLEQHVDTRRKKKERTDTLMIFHHWYIAQTVFPGQNTRFSYADQSLSPLFAQQEDLWLVSGHMHRAFIRERAICIGSIWHTSPLEYNQQKYLFQRDVSKKSLRAQPIDIAPWYRVVHEENKEIYVDMDAMERLRNEIWEASCQYLSTSHVSILCDPLAAEYSRQWSKVSIEDASACALHDLVDASVLRACGHVSAQHPHQHHRVLPEDLRDAQEALDTSFASRQQLLQAYIQKKRPDDADAYLTLLDTHDILK